MNPISTSPMDQSVTQPELNDKHENSDSPSIQSSTEKIPAQLDTRKRQQPTQLKSENKTSRLNKSLSDLHSAEVIADGVNTLCNDIQTKIEKVAKNGVKLCLDMGDMAIQYSELENEVSQVERTAEEEIVKLDSDEFMPKADRCALNKTEEVAATAQHLSTITSEINAGLIKSVELAESRNMDELLNLVVNISELLQRLKVEVSK